MTGILDISRLEAVRGTVDAVSNACCVGTVSHDVTDGDVVECLSDAALVVRLDSSLGHVSCRISTLWSGVPLEVGRNGVQSTSFMRAAVLRRPEL
eukprot:m.1444106 g.1444106  ORF g.1444106 m.1444106 type:complete len:95 (+) comp25104_c0_seq8:1180-1464(+)